jgi:DNA-binding PadR family transcriptional regulator
MNDAEFVVVGLLHEGAEYAYEIDQRIRERRLREWADVAFSSVYYLLHRAEGQGWVRSRDAPGRRGPTTKRYRLTRKGREELRRAVLARLQPSASAASVELAIMFAGVQSAEELREALLEYARQCRESAKQARERWDYLPPSPYRAYQDAIFDHGISLLEAQAEWAERTIERLRSAESP